jgi:hypothetical protein
MIFWSKSHVPGVNETVWGSKMRITASSGIGPTGSIKILADPDSSPRTRTQMRCPARNQHGIRDSLKIGERFAVWAVTFQGTFRILYEYARRAQIFGPKRHLIGK